MSQRENWKFLSVTRRNLVSDFSATGRRKRPTSVCRVWWPDWSSTCSNASNENSVAVRVLALLAAVASSFLCVCSRCSFVSVAGKWPSLDGNEWIRLALRWCQAAGYGLTEDLCLSSVVSYLALFPLLLISLQSKTFFKANSNVQFCFLNFEFFLNLALVLC